MASLVVTCEHATSYIPDDLKDRMNIPEDIEEHRVFDKGALGSAKAFAGVFSAEVHQFSVSRLLIDANRSIKNKNIFSQYAQNLTESERMQVLKDLYLPFRLNILHLIEKHTETIHISFHSFTPIFNGVSRDFEIGILYDPSRKQEADLSRGIVKHLAKQTNMKIFSNRPYKGTADGHTTALRREFPSERYIGIEIEMSQKLTKSVMVETSLHIADYLKNHINN